MNQNYESHLALETSSNQDNILAPKFGTYSNLLWVIRRAGIINDLSFFEFRFTAVDNNGGKRFDNIGHYSRIRQSAQIISH